MNNQKEDIKRAAEVAQFRFGVIAPVVQDLYPDPSRTAYYKRVASSPFTLPDGSVVVEKKADAMPKEKGMFLVTAFFELFDVLLSYFSNTLSFVRIGAFAVSHAAMMEVVLMLAGAESGNINWIVIVLGNVFVCAMEGLIVGIQVLRLEYYEMFSRFYKGEGHPFTPFVKKSVD